MMRRSNDTLSSPDETIHNIVFMRRRDFNITSNITLKKISMTIYDEKIGPSFDSVKMMQVLFKIF